LLVSELVEQEPLRWGAVVADQVVALRIVAIALDLKAVDGERAQDAPASGATCPRAGVIESRLRRDRALDKLWSRPILQLWGRPIVDEPEWRQKEITCLTL
jgi:hypothetical protein